MPGRHHSGGCSASAESSEERARSSPAAHPRGGVARALAFERPALKSLGCGVSCQMAMPPALQVILRESIIADCPRQDIATPLSPYRLLIGGPTTFLKPDQPYLLARRIQAIATTAPLVQTLQH